MSALDKAFIDEEFPNAPAVHVVRIADSHELVGIFVLPEGDERALVLAIDEATDVRWCEYTVLPSLGLLWGDAEGPKFTEFIDSDDEEEPGLTAPTFSETTAALCRSIYSWTPLGGEGQVYFVQAGAFVKIGYAVNVERRVKQLQIGTATTLKLLLQIPGGVKDEARYHHQFEDHHERGEWFRYEGSLKAFLETLR